MKRPPVSSRHEAKSKLPGDVSAVPAFHIATDTNQNLITKAECV
jgi:hypothetical protein